MKTDAQRLGNGKKAFNVKQVEKMVEDAGGSDYIAGTGIVIADDTISVDEQTVAMKSEIQPVLTAISPISINSDNEINLDGWSEVTRGSEECRTLYTETSGGIKLKEDVLLIWNDVNKYMYNVYYFVKGSTISNFAKIRFDVRRYYTSGSITNAGKAYATLTFLLINMIRSSGNVTYADAESKIKLYADADGIIHFDDELPNSYFSENIGSYALKLYRRKNND